MLSLRANRRRLSIEHDPSRRGLLLKAPEKSAAPRSPKTHVEPPLKRRQRDLNARRHTLYEVNDLPIRYMRGGGGGMPLSLTSSNNLHEDPNRKWPSENNNNNGQGNHVEVRGKSKKFTVSKSDEPSDVSGGCSDSGVSAPRSTPPIIVIESVTGDKTLAAAEKASDSGNDSDDDGGGAGGSGSPTTPLLPRPALRKSHSPNFASGVAPIIDEPDEEAIEAYKQRKRPSITFALDNDDDEEEEDEAELGHVSPGIQGMRRGSVRSPICSTAILEEDVNQSSENLVPMSVSMIERKRSNSSSSAAHSSQSSLISDFGAAYNGERRTSRAFTVINYGQTCSTSLPADVLARRASTQLTIPSINLSDSQYSPRPSINSLSIPADYNIKSSKLLKSLIADENRRNSMICDGIPRVATPPARYDRMNSHRGSIFTQTGQSIPRVAKRGWLYGQRRTQRLVNKQGDFNISYKNIRQKHVSYLVDLFTTVLDMKWRYTILLFVICFCTSWVVFALLWWFVAFIHGDHGNKEGPQKCVAEVYDFTTALLFSVETQHTIGYGVRAVTPDCPESILMLMLQSLFGVIVQCVMAGFVLAKLARPKYRAETIMFSKNAVIAQEDGEYCLLFRVGDMRRSQLVGAMLHAMFVKKRVTQEGDEIPFYQYHLEVSAESEDYDQFIFLSWPIRVIHRINRASPLWGVSADQLLIEDFEIIVVLEGVVEATGMTTQVRTSYLPSEILWGHRLKPLLTYRKDNGRYEIDYGRFHETQIDDEMPEESAQKRYEREHPDEADAGSHRTLPPLTRRSDSVSSYYLPAVTVPQAERVR